MTGQCKGHVPAKGKGTRISQTHGKSLQGDGNASRPSVVKPTGPTINCKLCRAAVGKTSGDMKDHIMLAHIKDNRLQCNCCPAKALWYDAEMKNHKHAGKTKPIEDHYERLEAQMKQFLARCFEKVQFLMVIVAWNVSE